MYNSIALKIQQKKNRIKRKKKPSFFNLTRNAQTLRKKKKKQTNREKKSWTSHAVRIIRAFRWNVSILLTSVLADDELGPPENILMHYSAEGKTNEGKGEDERTKGMDGRGRRKGGKLKFQSSVFSANTPPPLPSPSQLLSLRVGFTFVHDARSRVIFKRNEWPLHLLRGLYFTDTPPLQLPSSSSSIPWISYRRVSLFARRR